MAPTSAPSDGTNIGSERWHQNRPRSPITDP
jgi:hypothetical protein